MLKLIWTSLFLSIASLVMAQSNDANEEEVPWPQFYYQIFLDDSIQSVEDVIYTEDSTAIKFKLSPDKMAIYLLDYDGKSRITATFIDMAGLEQKITKPHCHIHGLEHL